jgi:hypothetical protein
LTVYFDRKFIARENICDHSRQKKRRADKGADV